ncbi:hypothetical protein CIHG_00217 [Coccidioides immitis H538.4]|uniref:Uncharacterized protein n=2 Tax=Coccidioides immitis TaxID=5501 RepID=A0A0J8TF21_COCIT|nr:hypothetical protein CISG_00501 [Coccidioides immitis RMSCC 3703]KMU82435.1 hypothetical protein CIHG_00217 [Coccidioides immitis H538.4]
MAGVTVGPWTILVRVLRIPAENHARSFSNPRIPRAYRSISGCRIISRSDRQLREVSASCLPWSAVERPPAYRRMPFIGSKILL